MGGGTIISFSLCRLMPGHSLAGPSVSRESEFPIDFNRVYMRFVCARDRHGRTEHGRERAGTAARGRRAPRGAMTTLHRRKATRKKQRARDDTQICHGSSGTEETPSAIQGWVTHRVTFLHIMQHTSSNSSRTCSYHRPESAYPRSGIANMLSMSTAQLAAALQAICITCAVV